MRTGQSASHLVRLTVLGVGLALTFTLVPGNARAQTANPGAPLILPQTTAPKAIVPAPQVIARPPVMAPKPAVAAPPKPAAAPPVTAAAPAQPVDAAKESAFAGLFGSTGKALIAQVGRDPSVKATAAAILARQPLPATHPRRAVETATDFKPVGARQAAERIASNTTDDVARASLRSVLENAASTMEAAPGFRRNNMAHGIGLMLAVSLQVASGAVLTEAESDRVLMEVNDALMATPVFASLTAERRTAIYDTAMINGAMVLLMWRQASELSNADQAALAQGLARDALTLFGLAPAP